MDSINRLFGGGSLEEIFQALGSDGSEWALKQLEVVTTYETCRVKTLLSRKQRIVHPRKPDYLFVPLTQNNKPFASKM